MELLLPYAYDDDGNLVYIDNAQKEHKYTCPNCGTDLSLKISKIPEGQKYHRRNHFAHKGNSDNHCSESFLHRFFKEKCAKYIQEKISAHGCLFFVWRCKRCGGQHRTNLLEKAVKVVLEYDLGVCRPDIALFDNNDNLLFVIEIVITHKPEPEVLKYYEDNKVVCLRIKVDNFFDCKNIMKKLSHPSTDSTILCTFPLNETLLKHQQQPQQLQCCIKPASVNHYENLTDFLQKQGNKICQKCGAALHIRKDWCNQPFLKCENLECNYKETLSDYDHILFPNMGKSH